eukprot:CAMPEP_0174354160 /NCGR_PEP_ID=MMETSP0811_2-20130205/18569_1 /TAXON_ID=73025 ORGANISM="Eutreptiella gymnastica-like, Strain CCMP1594" /NCGR_SAMPLE_ID=MMETSP0811_2 /ASSEMBLY_ACC=CAM_ASM_000667 /LENGTH=53 /DNA_ID=CAMNT_0015484939 /DNA_START=1226 /DNA_END=1384 /DNA_ORIENTATION=+
MNFPVSQRRTGSTAMKSGNEMPMAELFTKNSNARATVCTIVNLKMSHLGTFLM